MGAGKSRVGRAVAARLGWPFADGDALVEQHAGVPPHVLIERSGEAALRAAEALAYAEFLDSGTGGFVLACGGGAPLVPEVRERLADLDVIWLDVEADTAWERVGADGTDRPLARDRAAFEALLTARRAAYVALADERVDASSPDVVEEIVRHVRSLEPGLHWVPHATGDYSVVVRAGGITQVGERLAPRVPGSRAALVTDDGVPERLVAGVTDSLAGHFTVSVHRVPGGEASKSWRQAGELIEGLAADGLRRGDVVVALGGGVVGDLAGFAAATFLRGIRVCHVPTTLLAQVDSSIGGKTAVDLPQGKNLAGAIHQPVLVVSDPLALTSLPDREWRAGWAEVVKTALLAGSPLWGRVRDLEPMPAAEAGRVTDVIESCVVYKIGVVTFDERETGQGSPRDRAVLNLGHTLGHAVEVAAPTLVHGEAVAIGLRAALTASVRVAGLDPAVAEATNRWLDAWGLPASAPAGTDRARVAVAVARDKKGEAETEWVLLAAPGEPRSGQTLPPELVDELVAAACPP
jgi:shikimate kinase/3-dehydroquinate synthase